MGRGRGLSFFGVNIDCVYHRLHVLKCHNCLNTSENIDDNTTDHFASENSIYVGQVAV